MAMSLEYQEVNQTEVQPEQISSSQSDEPLGSRIKHRLEADWIYVIKMADQECFDFLKRGEYKMTATHNNMLRKCNMHPLNDHKMVVAYYRCTSKHCVQEKSDTCPHRNMVKKCQLDQMNYIFKLKDDHANKYKQTDNETVDHIHGMAPHAKPLIEKMLKANPCIAPIAILNALKLDLGPKAMPSLKQIQNFKSYLSGKINAGLDERSQVDALINQYQYVAGMDPNNGFIFAHRNGSGADDDPFYCGITAINWLTWLQKYYYTS